MLLLEPSYGKNKWSFWPPNIQTFTILAEECGDILGLWLPHMPIQTATYQSGVVSVSPCPLCIVLDYTQQFPTLQTNEWQASQEPGEMSLEKEATSREILSWPSTLCGPYVRCSWTPHFVKTPADLMNCA